METVTRAQKHLTRPQTPRRPSAVRPAPGSVATPGRPHTASVGPATVPPSPRTGLEPPQRCWAWPGKGAGRRSQGGKRGWALSGPGWGSRARRRPPRCPTAWAQTGAVPGPSPQPDQACHSRLQLASWGHERSDHWCFGFSRPGRSTVQVPWGAQCLGRCPSSKGALKVMTPGPWGTRHVS